MIKLMRNKGKALCLEVALDTLGRELIGITNMKRYLNIFLPILFPI